MKEHLNFGSVINAYVNNLFPQCVPIQETDDSSDLNDEADKPHDIPIYHKIVYTSFVLVILSLLISICLITVNIKSVFMVNKSIDYAINEIVSPNEAGFTYFIENINNRHNELMYVDDPESPDKEQTINSISVSLQHKEHIINIDQIKTRSDIAMWIQFGLIPSVVQSLNTFNFLVTNTILLTFKGIGKAYKFEVPNEVLSLSKLLLHSKPSVKSISKDGSGKTIQYSYTFNSNKDVNIQYIHGDTIDDILSSLMQGTGYLNQQPYFPLNAIISDDKINKVSAFFLTNNRLSNVFSSVEIDFNITETKTKVNGEEVTDLKIESTKNLSSYRINTSLFPLILDGVLILIYIAYNIYTIILYKLHRKSFFLFDYIFDVLFKSSVFLSLVFFNAIVIFANYRLPRVSKSNCEKAFCTSSIVLGYFDVKFDSERLINITFDQLNFSIRSIVIVFGLLCFFVLLSIFTSMIATWLVVNKNKQLSLRYKKYYYHLKMPIISLTIGLGLSIFLIAIFNSSVAHMFKSSSHSIFHNFFALFNLVMGISNEATLKYIDNYSIIYSIIFIMLLLVSFYLAIVLITSLLLMFDENENSLNFYKRPILWKYDNYRLIKFIHRISNIYNKVVMFIKSKVFRMKSIPMKHSKTKTKSDHNQSVEDETEDLEFFNNKWKFKFSFSYLFKIVTYLLMAGCIFGFGYYEYNCNKVSKVIGDTIDEMIVRTRHRWDMQIDFYDIKYSDLLEDSELTLKRHTGKITMESTLPNLKISTFNDLYYWLNIGSVKSLFTWVETTGESDLPQDKDQVIALNSRYYLHPNKMSVLFSMFFYLTPPSYLVANMKKVLFHDWYYQLINFQQNKHGFEELFDNMINTIPDTVNRVMLDLIVFDSKSMNKIYNAKINFYMEKSGMMLHDVTVDNVFTLFLPPKNRNIIYYTILGCMAVFFLVLVGLFIKDINNFRNGFFMYYHGSNWLEMILMYFLNDIRRVLDFIIILLVVCLLSLSVSIFIYRSIILKHIDEFEDIFYRYYYQILSRRIFYLHASVIVFLGCIVGFGLILKSERVRHYLYVGLSVLYQMKYLYTSIVFYFMSILFTYLFFYYFISKDYFSDFIKGNKFFRRCVRLILYDHQFFGDFKDKNLTELLLYPLCLTFKIWLTNVIFYHLWSVWPKSDYSKSGTHSTEQDLFDEPDELEEKFKHSDLEITNITQRQLDALPREIKSKAADESTSLFNKFKEFHNSYMSSGKHKHKFIVKLHEELGNEMNDLLDISNKLEFRVGIIDKQTEVLQNKSFKELEEHISMLEESLGDKREELNSVFESYKAKLKNEV